MKIAIMGMGVEGQALVKYFLRKGAEIHIRDKKTPEAKIPKAVHAAFGENYFENLETFDCVFRSPGIPFMTPTIQNLVKKGRKVSSLIKYFFERCPCHVIGVTGTKGKGTVATLLFEILKKSEKKSQRIFLGGNIGHPPLEFLDDLKKEDIVVLELSSFQLQDLDQSPHGAIILPISEDHLDHHQTMEEYILAKKNIACFQKKSDFIVAHIDNPIAREFLKISKGEKFEVSLKNSAKKGGFLQGTELFLVEKNGEPEFLCDISEISLSGMHNVGNILAAAVAAKKLGIAAEVIRETVKNFQGLPHRLEFIREINGVKYFNDSASTNPETCIAALKAFNAPIILIAGGSTKRADYTKLGEEIVQNPHTKAVILMGETRKAIESAVDRATEKFGRTIPLEIISAENFAEALMTASALAAPDDVVVLSPASASFDMFKNYQERGELFKRWVLTL